MLRRMIRRQRGFTLIELLIVVAIIGIIAALLIPNFLESLQKAKQKRTMADMKNMGTAMVARQVNIAGAAAAGYEVTMATWGGTGWMESFAEVETAMSPTYTTAVPPLDGWKHGFCYTLNTANPLDAHVMAIHSGGRDSTNANPCNAWPTSVTPTSSGPYDPDVYTNDILWADGAFVMWPEKLTPIDTTP